jgi:hypothetical protein
VKRAAAAVITTLALSLGMTGTAPAAVTRTRQLTGTQLAAALLPATDFPVVFAPPGPPSDSGSQLENSPARYHLATMSCDSITLRFGREGFGETAVAATGYYAFGASSTQYTQDVYQFRTAGPASSFFRGLRAIWSRCPAFTFPTGSPRTRVSTALPADGYAAFQDRGTGMLEGSKVNVDLLSVIAGPDVLTILSITGVPSADPASRPLMDTLIARVLARR